MARHAGLHHLNIVVHVSARILSIGIISAGVLFSSSFLHISAKVISFSFFVVSHFSKSTLGQNHFSKNTCFLFWFCLFYKVPPPFIVHLHQHDHHHHDRHDHHQDHHDQQSHRRRRLCLFCVDYPPFRAVAPSHVARAQGSWSKFFYTWFLWLCRLVFFAFTWYNVTV